MKITPYIFLLSFVVNFVYANEKAKEPSIESNLLDPKQAFTSRVWTADYLGQYRIPSLAETKHKILLAFIEKRDRQGDQSGNDLVLKRSLDGGKSWGEEQFIYEQGNDSINNPTLIVSNNNIVTLLFNVVPKGYSLFSNLPKGSTTIKVKVIYSSDNGASWTQPIDITGQLVPKNSYLVNVGPGNGIEIQHGQYAGRAIVPAYAKMSPGRDISKTYAMAIYNDAIAEFPLLSGQSITQQQAIELSEQWQIGNTTWKSLANEIIITEYGFKGKLYYLARQHSDRPRGGTNYDSSFDGGMNWLGRRASMTTFPFRTQSGLARFENNLESTNAYVMTTPVGPWRYSKGRTDGRIIRSTDNALDNLTWRNSTYRVITEYFFSNSSTVEIYSKLSATRVGVLYEGNLSKTENKVGYINFSSINLGYVKSGETYHRP